MDAAAAPSLPPSRPPPRAKNTQLHCCLSEVPKHSPASQEMTTTIADSMMGSFDRTEQNRTEQNRQEQNNSGSCDRHDQTDKAIPKQGGDARTRAGKAGKAQAAHYWPRGGGGWGVVRYRSLRPPALATTNTSSPYIGRPTRSAALNRSAPYGVVSSGHLPDKPCTGAAPPWVQHNIRGRCEQSNKGLSIPSRPLDTAN